MHLGGVYRFQTWTLGLFGSSATILRIFLLVAVAM
jgi:hypothetical protein